MAAWWPTVLEGTPLQTNHNVVSLITLINCYNSRKGGLLLNNVLGIGGACLMWFTKVTNSYEMLFIGRFIIGVNCGKCIHLPKVKNC